MFKHYFYYKHLLRRELLDLKTGISLTKRAKQAFFNPFAPGDFAEKCVLKLVEWFSGHCRAIKS